MENLIPTYNYLKQFLTEKRLEKMEHFSKESTDYVLPVMEDVYQYRNAAAIIRSAEAFGFHKIVALEEENIFNPNLRVTKGAQNWVEVEKMPAQINSIKEIKANGYKIVAVSPEKQAISLPDFRISEPIALVFGTELEGLNNEVIEIADETLSIPMYGFTQSFNVSVAAAICFYELKQKLIHSRINYHLSEEKRMKLMIKWMVNSIPSGREIYKKWSEEKS